MRVEFNPNKLSHDEVLWLKQNIISYLDDVSFTRLDLAFDFEFDLNDYYALSDKSVKKTIFYGRNVKPETKYFGVRNSDRFIRIYDQKQERKDNADVEIDSTFLWRVEIELKRDMVDCWKDCFDDLHILKPNLKMIENIQERAMLHLLTHEEEEWGNLERRTKNKYRDKLKNIASIDLTDLMKISLRGNQNQLQKQIDFWLN